MNSTASRSARQQRSQLWLLLTLVAALRLGSLLLLRPGGFFADFSDFYYYRDYAALSDRGLYPYVNIWSPYPPMFPWLLVAIHRLSLLLPPWEQPQFFFSLGLGSVLALAECGNTGLVYALAGGAAKHRRALRSAIFYALMFVPAYTAQAHYDSLPVFFLLLGLWLLSTHRWRGAGAVTALGVMTKLLPGLLAPVALRLAWGSPSPPARLSASDRGGGVRYLLCLLLVAAAIVAPFCIANPRLLLAPFDIERIRPPWQTVWAVIDGYYGFGLAPADVRDLAALDGPAWSGRVPYWLLTAGFATIWTALYLQKRDWRRTRTAIVFVALSLSLLFLFSKGWSPQYLAWIVPFLAILWPSWRGGTFALALTFLNYLESHVYFMLLPQERWLLVLTTASRAAVLAVLCLTLAGDYLGWRPLAGAWRGRLRCGAAALLAVGLPLIGWRLLADYAADRYAQEPARTAIEYVAGEADDGASIFFARQVDLERFYPTLHGMVRLRTLDDRPGDGDLERHLVAQLASGSPQDVWLVEPEDGASDLAAKTREALAAIAYLDGDAVLAGHRVSRWLPFWALSRPAEAIEFGDQVGLLGWRSDGHAAVGEPLSVVLVWQLRQPLSQPLSAFVHLSAGEGAPVAQSDGPPAWPWPTDATIVDRRTIETAGLPAGTYNLVVGLYDPSSGARLLLPDGADSLVIAEAVLVVP